MDQDLISVKEARGPSTPPLDKLDAKHKRQADELRDLSESPTSRKRSKDDSKHSKERKKRKEKRRQSADVESDDNNSISCGDQEMMEH